MRSLAVLGALAVLIAAGAYASSFYGVSSVLAWHGNPCGGGNPPCNNSFTRYYAKQYRCCSQGLGGAVRSFDLSLWDPANDFIAEWLSVNSVSGNSEWTQMGFTEGVLPDGSSPLSPIAYEEYNRTDCDPTYVFADRGLVSGYHERFWVYSDGETRRCPSNPSKWVYLWWFKRTSWSNLPFDVTYLSQAGGKFLAGTELFDATHMEPANNICFGTYNNCSTDPGYGLSTYNPSSKTWSLWTPQAYLQEDAGYHRTGLADYWAFYTWGW